MHEGLYGYFRTPLTDFLLVGPYHFLIMHSLNIYGHKVAKVTLEAYDHAPRKRILVVEAGIVNPTPRRRREVLGW